MAHFQGRHSSIFQGVQQSFVEDDEGRLVTRDDRDPKTATIEMTIVGFILACHLSTNPHGTWARYPPQKSGFNSRPY